MHRRLLLSCALALLASSARAATVDVADDGTGEPTLMVETGRPETSFSGKIGYNTRSWGYYSALRQQFAAGEEFCAYMPVMGMHNFTCHILLSKYWDIDAELTVRDSEGELVGTGNITVIGKRTPFAAVSYLELKRPDIVQVCLRNTGAVKTIRLGFSVTRLAQIKEKTANFLNLTQEHNMTAQVIGRLENLIVDMKTMAKGDISFVSQDYFRLKSIKKWIDGRCIAGSLLMLFCCFMSTVVIRRWFGSPRSSV